MKLRTGGVFILLIFAGIFMMGCRDGNTPEENTDKPIAVTFTDLTANGSSIAATSKLTLTFDKDIADLAAADIDFTAGTTGTSKGSLTHVEMGVYELAVSGVTESGNVTVSVAKTGFAISGGPISVMVYPAPSGGGPTAVVFTDLTANGSSTTVTTKLTLTFDKDIAGLTATDISLSAGTTGAIKGSLTRTGTGVYELAISGVTENGNVTVTVAKTGFTITGGPKTLGIFYPNSSSGTKVTDWHELIVPAQTNATQYASYEGRNDVLHLAPTGAEYAWSVLEYSLNAYANKEITITLGMEVWLETEGKVAWQVNQTGYPTIAGSTLTNLSPGQWHTITGSNTITVDGTGKVVYLSRDQLGRTNKACITNFVMTIDDGSPPPVEGEILLTIGAKQNLADMITNNAMSGKTLTWSSSNANVASVTNNGTVTAVNFTNGGGEAASSAATGTATITARTTDNITETFTIRTTMVAQVNMMDLPPLKDQFASHFLIGNIFNPSDATAATGINNTRLTRHYNVLSAENNMKPQYLAGATRGTYNETNIATAKRMISAANASGMKVLGHTLLWHSQIPDWQKNIATDDTTSAQALGYMKEYITYIVNEFKGTLWAWDVLNEIFPDNAGNVAGDTWQNSMRTADRGGQGANPWFIKIGSDFVYEGYLAARLADTNAILYYNDYNLNQSGKAQMVRDMVAAVNAKYAQEYPSETRKLIEGIGMQSHHNTDITVAAVKATLDLFQPLGVKISISEIDVLSQSWSDYSNSTPPTNNQKLTAANLYGEYFKLFIQYKAIIERVTFWGVYDEQSWRARGLPLIFEGNPTSKAKPAYYKVVGTLE